MSTRVCVRARVCVRVCERVSFVLSFYQKHTRQINQMSQRDETGRRHTSSFPLSLLSLLMMTNSRLLNMFFVCATVCVCLYSASGVAAAVNCRQFPRQSSAASSPSLWHCLHLLLLAHTHYTHTTTTAVYVPMCVCVCEAINLMIY